MSTHGTGYTFAFAGAICLVCSVALAGVSLSLKEMQDLNKKRDLQSNILMALGLTDEAGGALKGDAIDTTWQSSVELLVLDATGKPVDAATADINGDGVTDQLDLNLALAEVKGTPDPARFQGVYLRKDGGKTLSVALPLNGQGLWGPISGYLALDAKGEKIKGTAFFAPKETPGLGAEIQADNFKQQWVGKKLSKGGAPTPVRVVKGKAADICSSDIDYCVDGVSGATITSDGVTDMVAKAVTNYDPYLKSLRGAM